MKDYCGFINTDSGNRWGSSVNILSNLTVAKVFCQKLMIAKVFCQKLMIAKVFHQKLMIARVFRQKLMIANIHSVKIMMIEIFKCFNFNSLWSWN